MADGDDECGVFVNAFFDFPEAFFSGGLVEDFVGFEDVGDVVFFEEGDEGVGEFEGSEVENGLGVGAEFEEFVLCPAAE